MDSLFEQLHPGVVALFFAAAMLTSWSIGRVWGKRWPGHPDDKVAEKFTDASMALLGLLLAFTFSMALSRYDNRREASIAHSNALGDFYTCASLLKEPYRSRLQDLLHEYAQFKLDRARNSFIANEREQAIQRSLDYYSRATTIVRDAVAAGTPIAVPLVDTLNNLTSSNTTHRATYRERLPWIIGILLMLGSIIPAFLLGQRQGAKQGAHLSGIFSFFILVTFVIYVILDLNQPTSGTIRVNQESLERVIQGMTK